jgi:small ligand-binding sensory domain FIST
MRYIFLFLVISSVAIAENKLTDLVVACQANLKDGGIVGCQVQAIVSTTKKDVTVSETTANNLKLSDEDLKVIGKIMDKVVAAKKEQKDL